jgi:hypothetical protein
MNSNSVKSLKLLHGAFHFFLNKVDSREHVYCLPSLHGRTRALVLETVLHSSSCNHYMAGILIAHGAAGQKVVGSQTTVERSPSDTEKSVSFNCWLLFFHG